MMWPKPRPLGGTWRKLYTMTSCGFVESQLNQQIAEPRVAPDHWPADRAGEQAADVVARTAALHYWSEVGWPVRAVGERILLAAEENLLGLSIPLPFAWHVLEQLRAHGAHGPVIGIPGSGLRRWIFLVEGFTHPPNMHPQSDLLVMRAGTDIPLPPTRLPHGTVEWIARPDSGGTLFDHASVSLVADLLLGRRS